MGFTGDARVRIALNGIKSRLRLKPVLRADGRGIVDGSGKMLALNRISPNSNPFLTEIHIVVYSEIFSF